MGSTKAVCLVISCSTVRSMGEIINQLPDDLPFVAPKVALQLTADSSRVHEATRVAGNVPIFSQDVQLAMPAQKKLMHDSARTHKRPKDITFDAGSREVFYDPEFPMTQRFLAQQLQSRDHDPLEDQTKSRSRLRRYLHSEYHLNHLKERPIQK